MHVFDKFLHSINIVLLQNQVLGLTVLTVSRRKLKKSKLRLSVTITVALLFVVSKVYHFYLRIFFAEESVLYKSIDVLILITNSTYIVSLWLHGVFSCDYFSQLLTAMIQFDRNLLLFGHFIDYDKQRRNDLLHSCVRYATVALIMFYFLLLSPKLEENLLFESTRALVLVLKMAICQQLVQLVTIIKTRLEILNGYLREILASEDNHRVKIKRRLTTLCKICDMHHNIIKITKLFNKTFGVVLLLTFGLSFINIVICFFYISASLQTTDIDFKHGSLALTLSIPFIGDTIYICNVCYKTVEEANLIGELLQKIETEDQDLIDETEMFSLQIMNAPIEFSAAQFFPVDRTLIFSIIGGVTTYIIILIQLSSTLLENK